MDFNPDRFSQKQTSYAYFPFEGGPRVCIGNHFALQEATIIIAMVMQTFEIESCPSGEKPVFEPLITMRLKNGLTLTIRPRRHQ
ncbi:cytochrome P450 [Bacillus sp. AK031]